MSGFQGKPLRVGDAWDTAQWGGRKGAGQPGQGPCISAPATAPEHGPRLRSSCVMAAQTSFAEGQLLVTAQTFSVVEGKANDQLTLCDFLRLEPGNGPFSEVTPRVRLPLPTSCLSGKLALLALPRLCFPELPAPPASGLSDPQQPGRPESCQSGALSRASFAALLSKSWCPRGPPESTFDFPSSPELLDSGGGEGSAL